MAGGGQRKLPQQMRPWSYFTIQSKCDKRQGFHQHFGPPEFIISDDAVVSFLLHNDRINVSLFIFLTIYKGTLCSN